MKFDTIIKGTFNTPLPSGKGGKLSKNRVGREPMGRAESGSGRAMANRHLLRSMYILPAHYPSRFTAND